MLEFHLQKGLKKIKLKTKFKEDIEPQEIFWDALAKKKEEEFGLSEKKFEIPLSKNILRGFRILFSALILLLLVKTFQFQIIQGKDFSLLSEQNKFKVRQIEAERGVLYDQKGRQLARNLPNFNLILDKRDFTQDEAERARILNEVAGILKKDPEQLKDEINKEESFKVLISDNLDHQTLITLETKIGDFKGFLIENNTVREYAGDSLFSHLLGYTAKINQEELKANPGQYSISDRVGGSGVEKFYEDVLRKNPGKLLI